MKGLIPTPRAGSLAQISGDTIFFLGGMRSFVEYPELMTYDISNVYCNCQIIFHRYQYMENSG